MSILGAVFAQPIAHRGLHDLENNQPENSVEAFDAAVRAGFAVECDLQLSGDNVAVVFHDYTLDRMTAQSGALNDISGDQISRIPLNSADSTIMRFSDFLEMIGDNTPVVVELKSQGENNSELAHAANDAAKDYKGKLAFKSFDPRILSELRAANCKWPIGIVLEKERAKNVNALKGFILRHLLHYPWTKFDFVSCNISDLELPMVRLFRALGYKTMTWTVDTASEMDRAAMHADQIVFEGEAAQLLGQSVG